MGELIDCPYCAEKVKSEAIICKHCGKELDTEDAIDKIQVNKIKDLKFRLKDKIKLYLIYEPMKNVNDLEFLEKLENMSSDKIEQDIFYKIRNKKVLILNCIF
jgi:hypothetical protein